MSQFITFYPLGNAESILLELSNNKKILFDFADTHSEDSNDKRINLSDKLKSKQPFDVVVFTHAHDDHVKGAKDFFEFDYDEEFQGNGRSKIKELWVSSAFILDSDLKSEDAKIIRKEAQHRLIKGYGIKVFSEPNKLSK